MSIRCLKLHTAVSELLFFSDPTSHLDLSSCCFSHHLIGCDLHTHAYMHAHTRNPAQFAHLCYPRLISRHLSSGITQWPVDWSPWLPVGFFIPLKSIFNIARLIGLKWLDHGIIKSCHLCVQALLMAAISIRVKHKVLMMADETPHDLLAPTPHLSSPYLFCSKCAGLKAFVADLLSACQSLLSWIHIMTAQFIRAIDPISFSPQSLL